MALRPKIERNLICHPTFLGVFGTRCEDDHIGFAEPVWVLEALQGTRWDLWTYIELEVQTLQQHCHNQILV